MPAWLAIALIWGVPFLIFAYCILTAQDEPPAEPDRADVMRDMAAEIDAAFNEPPMWRGGWRN